jgi:thioredoxin reductase (NADPH)
MVRDAQGVRPLECRGVFVAIGLKPETALARDLVQLDGSGLIAVDAWMRTTTPGLFAVGDIRQDSARQLISAAGDGATAAIAARRFFATGEWRKG